MSNGPERSDIVGGPALLIAALLSNYQCGHCDSETEVRHDRHGNPHLIIHHDDGCPVLTGAISSIPDTVRAAAGQT
ncbi:hypothetical protein OG741_13950 [Streptomyces sp. NBC_01410]|uniref:hypothetical protein n=1 Tax=Streptomyces sp. NBC_01410 TaxID=2903856 RepID=UPI003250B2B3